MSTSRRFELCPPPNCPKCKHGNPGMRYNAKAPDKAQCTCYNCKHEWTITLPPEPPEEPKQEGQRRLEEYSDAEIAAETQRRKVRL